MDKLNLSFKLILVNLFILAIRGDKLTFYAEPKKFIASYDKNIKKDPY